MFIWDPWKRNPLSACIKEQQHSYAPSLKQATIITNNNSPLYVSDFAQFNHSSLLAQQTSVFPIHPRDISLLRQQRRYPTKIWRVLKQEGLEVPKIRRGDSLIPNSENQNKREDESWQKVPAQDWARVRLAAVLDVAEGTEFLGMMKQSESEKLGLNKN